MKLYLKIVIPLVVTIFLSSLIFTNTHELAFKIKYLESQRYLRSFYVIGCVFLLLFSFSFFIKINSREWIKSLGLFVYSFMLLFFLLELVFMYIPVSQGSGEAYCQRLWFNKYWKTNEYGFRDLPYNAYSDTLKDKILILGDSYVAGHGIKNVEDRISNLLQQKLGNDYRVFNLGQNGSHTEKQFNNLKKFPYKYDKLILIHVPNDLEYLDREKSEQSKASDEIEFSSNESQEPGCLFGLFSFLKQESFFVNFLSYTFIGEMTSGIYYSLTSSKSKLQSKPNEIYPFSDSLLLDLHLKNLIWMDSVFNQENVHFLLVSFPYPGNKDKVAENYYEGFISRLKQTGINLLDANYLCKKLPVRKQIVSNLDRHPSVLMNKEITDSIYHRLRQEGWFDN